jgi:NTP pyrophosphatase (non-canonical NTP hydrolase)
MDMTAYQREALKTDRVPASSGEVGDTSLIVPLLGLAGEAGQLLSEYKKYLRDGEAHRLFKERVAEELGDLLWYISNVATKFELDLAKIAEGNLAKTQSRWGSDTKAPYLFDDGFPEGERLPRRFEVEFTEESAGHSVRVRGTLNGKQLGAELTDNAYDPDGYRFHDVFHLAYAAVLGWSPVIRALLKRKRKSNPAKDEVEDGGRATVIDEGIAAFVFDYARAHDFLDGVGDLDYEMLRSIMSLTARLEVSACSIGDWQRAITQGFEVWREVLRNSGGRVLVDLDAQRISYLGPPKQASGANP